jgi:hypothetical protein
LVDDIIGLVVDKEEEKEEEEEEEDGVENKDLSF